MSGCARLLDRIAEELVLAEPKDLQALAAVHSHIEELVAAAKPTGSAEAVELAKSIGKQLEGIILGDAADPVAALDAVGRSVSALRVALVEGRPIDPPTTQNAATKGSTAVADDQIVADFLARQDSVLHEMEGLILDFEKGLGGALPALQRLLHTLKGETALLGFESASEVCHKTEDLLGATLPPKADRLLAVRDWLSKEMNHRSGRGPAPAPFDFSVPAQPAPAAPSPAAPAAAAPTIAAPTGLPDPSLAAEFINEALDHLEGADAHLMKLEGEPKHGESLGAVFRVFHTIKGVAGFLGLDEIGTLAHEAENLLDKARKNEILLDGARIQVIFESADLMKRLVQNLATALTTGTPPALDPGVPALIVKIRSAIEGEAVSAPAAQREAAPAPEAPVGSRPETARPATEAEAAGPAAPGSAAIRETVKVDADRLDALIDAIGELVIAESMVGQSREIRGLNSPTLSRHLNQLDKITRELQAMGMGLRMVPVKATFQKMARLVRDLSRKSGKQVEFAMSGEDTELDKTVVDRIGDPLVHMVRNSADHGIEPDPAVRRAAGKPEAGRVELRAFHKGGSIYIEIEDDGRGLDKDAILAKARKQGLIRADAMPTDAEIYNCIFLPGFSTAAKVTDISGRGVGMDVVRRAIESLRGQIEIRTEKGRGTTFSIRLPLTLAIIDGMVVRLGAERYILPTLSIVRTVRPAAGEISTVQGRGELLQQQGRLLPLFRLGRLFACEAQTEATKAVALILEDEGRQVALLVDELLGQQQTVIKSLGEGMKKIPGVSGGAIMADGTVGLILDAGGLVALAHGTVTDAEAPRLEGSSDSPQPTA